MKQLQSIQKLQLQIILIFLLLSFSLFVFKEVRAESVHLYLAIGQNYAVLGSARVGYDNYEVGIYAPGVYAVSRLFTFSNNFYTSLAGGYCAGYPGMAASIGINYKRLFRGLGVRGEVFAYENIRAFTDATGTIGVTWQF